MSKTRKLAPHRRLYLQPDAPQKLRRKPELPFLAAAARKVQRDAEQYADLPPLDWENAGHNAHLVRARKMQARVVTLLVQWSRTNDDRFRQGVLQSVRQMGEWEYWSWIAWRAGDNDPGAIFDLSYGENSATLAIAYDWLHATLSTAERKLFLDVAHKWSFAASSADSRWFGRSMSNWNTVCAGGLGMLCLSMYEDVPIAPKLLGRVEESIAPYFQHLDEVGGAWPEGVGYWNYGMRYGFMYLLSWEAATGEIHPHMKRLGVKKTMSFPLDFTPHGNTCSFGDVNRWVPMPFHHAAAARLGRRDVLARLDAWVQNAGASTPGLWPDAAEWLVLHPHTMATAPANKSGSRGGVRIYRGQDWGIIADDFDDPRLYVSFRGGSTDVPHAHRDLLSFHVVVGREHLIADCKPEKYLDSTFSPRRNEIFGITPAAKNTILINGVGVTVGAQLNSTRKLSVPGGIGVRMDATDAMGISRDGAAVAFCGRALLMLDERAVLIVDCIVLPFEGRAESRMHSFAKVTTRKQSASIRSGKEKLSVAYAANFPGVLAKATTAPTFPKAPQATALRWCSEELHREMTLAMLLVPGGEARLELSARNGHTELRCNAGKWKRVVRLTGKLQPARTR